MIGGIPLYATVTSTIVPNSIYGMVGWYDATVGVTGTSGGAIDAVADQSGAGNNVTASSPNRPVWGTGTTDGFKSGTRNSFKFPGNETNRLVRAKVYCAAGYSAFITFKATGTATTSSNSANPPMTFIGDTATDVYNGFGLNGGDVSYKYYTGSFVESKSTGLSLNNGAVHTIAVAHDSLGNLNLYADGVNVLSQTFKTWSSSFVGFNTIGMGYGSGDFAKDAYLGEVMIWNSPLSGTQVQNLHQRALSVWT